MTNLISVNDHNKSIFEHYDTLNKPHPNGVACPECGKELWDSAPNIILTTYPPKKNVYCPNCNYTGYLLC